MLSKLTNSEITISNISKTDKIELGIFYKKIFPSRYKNLINNWKWWYRNNLNDKEPIILLNKKKVIGQAAFISSKVEVNNKKINTIWFQDYAVLPEYTGKGYGKLLCSEWMKICPDQMAICSPFSLRVLKKFNWKENYDTKRFVKPINFTKFLPLIRNYDNKFLNNLFKNFIRFKDKKSDIKIYKMTKNFDILEDAFSNRVENFKENYINIVRDEDWLKWRLLDCPYKDDIFFFQYKNNFTIVHLYKSGNTKRLNIMYSFYTDTSQEAEILMLIINWSIQNNVDFVWIISCDNELKKYFTNFLTKPLRLATWSQNKKNFNLFKNGISNLQGIDSDIESGMYIDK
tara:strand:- start:207 stop:1238 length:1032 start_codon:yes stop_codon:yes gene_type:complete